MRYKHNLTNCIHSVPPPSQPELDLIPYNDEAQVNIVYRPLDWFYNGLPIVCHYALSEQKIIIICVTTPYSLRML